MATPSVLRRVGIARAVIDLHSHILSGVDDGPRTIEGSLEIARQAVADGVELAAATPHVRSDHPTRPGAMERGVDVLRDTLRRERIPLDLRTGGEIAVDWLERLSGEDLRRFGLAGSSEYLLVEFPYYGWPLALPEWIFRLQTMGITAVLAHPERNPEVQEAPDRLRALVDLGALVQITAASLDGRVGRSAQRTGAALIELELAHLIASDAHEASIRQTGMTAAARAVGDPALAGWLTREVPLAIVSGWPLPSRPPPDRRRRSWPWRR
jgi:protein-tyrosine phosphatase